MHGLEVAFSLRFRTGPLTESGRETRSLFEARRLVGYAITATSTTAVRKSGTRVCHYRWRQLRSALAELDLQVRLPWFWAPLARLGTHQVGAGSGQGDSSLFEAINFAKSSRSWGRPLARLLVMRSSRDSMEIGTPA